MRLHSQLSIVSLIELVLLLVLELLLAVLDSPETLTEFESTLSG